MVIIVSKEGQLANRILHASSFIVNAQEHRYRVLHLFFDDYYSFFSESLSGNKSPIRFLGKKSSWLVSSFQKLVTLGVKIFLKLGITKLPFFEIVRYEGYEQGLKPFDLNDEKFIKKARSKLVLVYGWLFGDHVNQKKQRQILLDTWLPNKIYHDKVEEYVTRYKKDHDLLIGIHIRGGDFKRFEGGKWFYTPEQYYEKMKELAMLERFRDKKIAFVICTNEKNISLSSAGNFTVYNEERHFIEDMYLLSRCDHIIGPPSTFSIWASFYGCTPLYMIGELETKITDEIFKTNSKIH